MAKTVTIDVSTVASKSELHALLAESLSLPSFYGKNWDAFWDSITGLVDMPEVLEFRGIEHLKKALPKEATQLMTCLRDLPQDYPEIHCEIRFIP